MHESDERQERKALHYLQSAGKMNENICAQSAFRRRKVNKQSQYSELQWNFFAFQKLLEYPAALS